MTPLYEIFDPWVIERYKQSKGDQVEMGCEIFGSPGEIVVESSFGLWYYPILNAFFDDNDQPVVDLHEYLDPWVIREWKRRGKCSAVETKTGEIVELFYADSDDEEFLFGTLDRSWMDWERDNYERYCAAMYHDWESEQRRLVERMAS